MEKRRLIDLVSVGKKTIEDFDLLGIKTVEQLKNLDAKKLFQKLQKITKSLHDPCCEDVFKTAIEQAKNRNLPREKCNWYYWSKIRKKNR